MFYAGLRRFEAVKLKWSDLDFLNAVQRGLSPEGEHLIPALPYTSYVHMKPGDVLDIRLADGRLTARAVSDGPATGN